MSSSTPLLLHAEDLYRGYTECFDLSDATMTTFLLSCELSLSAMFWAVHQAFEWLWKPFCNACAIVELLALMGDRKRMSDCTNGALSFASLDAAYVHDIISSREEVFYCYLECMKNEATMNCLLNWSASPCDAAVSPSEREGWYVDDVVQDVSGVQALVQGLHIRVSHVPIQEQIIRLLQHCGLYAR